MRSVWYGFCTLHFPIFSLSPVINGALVIPFLFLFFTFFVMEEIHYRGRGSGRLGGLSFSLSLSFPYDQWSIEEQLHNVLPWAKEEGKDDPLLLLLLLVRLVWLTQSSSRGCGAPLAFSLLHLFFPPLFLRVGGEKLEALSFPPSGIQRPAGAWASSNSTISLDLYAALQGIFLKPANTPSANFSFSVDFCILLQLCWVHLTLELVLMANIWPLLANWQSSSMWGRCLWGGKL